MWFDEEEQKKAQAAVAARCAQWTCNFAGCRAPCVEKVETDMAGRYGHPLTAYVCREHYDAIMHGGKGALSPEAQERDRAHELLDEWHEWAIELAREMGWANELLAPAGTKFREKAAAAAAEIIRFREKVTAAARHIKAQEELRAVIAKQAARVTHQALEELDDPKDDQ